MKTKSLSLGLLLFLISTISYSYSQKKSTLKVGIYLYLPQIGYAIERLETEFEKKHEHIDLELHIFDSYSPKPLDSPSENPEFDQLNSISEYDLVEIDLIRLEELINGKYGGIEALPKELRISKDRYVAGAKAIQDSVWGEYIIPHWLCGNYVFTRSFHPTNKAENFENWIEIIDNMNTKIYADLWGSSTLGAYYADAYLDIYGKEKMLAHFQNENFTLDTTALNRILDLVSRMDHGFQDPKVLSKFHDLPQIYPQNFSKNLNSILIGYPERLYFANKQRLLTIESEKRSFDAKDLSISQINFSNKSNGTPTWLDGFVIPKGKYKRKRKEIKLFIDFILSKDGFDCFQNPKKWTPYSYLIPAEESGYQDNKPLLEQFKNLSDETFIVGDKFLFSQFKKAGGMIEEMISKKF